MADTKASAPAATTPAAVAPAAAVSKSSAPPTLSAHFVLRAPVSVRVHPQR
jgi:hypothetical protein